MRKSIIKIIGATLFSLMMIYNISDTQSSLYDNISLSLLDNRAHAQSETPSYKCPGGNPECVRIYEGSTTHIFYKN